MSIKVVLVGFLCIFTRMALVNAAPAQDATILKSENMIMKESYRFSYETSDGQTREEMGIIMNAGTDKEELVVVGSYSYTGTDNEVYSVMYTADKNGYRPRIMTKGLMRKMGMLGMNALKSLVG